MPQQYVRHVVLIPDKPAAANPSFTAAANNNDVSLIKSRKFGAPAAAPTLA